MPNHLSSIFLSMVKAKRGGKMATIFSSFVTLKSRDARIPEETIFELRQLFENLENDLKSALESAV